MAACLIALSCGLLSNPARSDAADFAAEVDGLLTLMYPSLDNLYKDIHSHPELAFQEVRTAGLLATGLRELGFVVTEKVATTGVVGVYRNGPGPTVMVRTELDALPVEEKTGLPYASHEKAVFKGRETFVAHSCGHDIHMATWIGTARTLVAMKDKWRGTLLFIAQPGEEGAGGAKAMLADGLFTRFPRPDYALALHTYPIPYGTIAYNVGPVTSNSDEVEITFKGRGTHGAYPHKSIDPITIASHFVVDVQTVVSREKDPFAFGVVTIGAFQAGTAGNVIPDTAVLRGTIRSYDRGVRDKLLDGVRRTAEAAAAMSAAPSPSVVLREGGLAVINSETVTARIAVVLKSALGDRNVSRVPPIPASEDFSVFVDQGIPSMFFLIGVSDPVDFEEASKPGGKPLPGNHSALFAPVPEPSIKTGTKAMALAVLNVLTSP